MRVCEQSYEDLYFVAHVLCLCEHTTLLIQRCVCVDILDGSATNNPVVSVGSVAGSADLEAATPKGWGAPAFRSSSPPKFEKYRVNPYINHPTPGSLSTSKSPAATSTFGVKLSPHYNQELWHCFLITAVHTNTHILPWYLFSSHPLYTVGGRVGSSSSLWYHTANADRGCVWDQMFSSLSGKQPQRCHFVRADMISDLHQCTALQT